MGKKVTITKDPKADQIEKHLKHYQNGNNADIKKIADVYFSSDAKKQNDIIEHYSVNGSKLINAIFNNDVKTMKDIYFP